MHQPAINTVLLAASALLVASCGHEDSSKLGNAPTNVAADVAAPNASLLSSGPDWHHGPGHPGPDHDIQARALRACLDSWPDQPFGNQATADRVLTPAVTVFGHGKALDDEVYTSGPSLTLIPAAVNILGDVEYDLLNPNGWYCLVTSVDIFSNTDIYLKSSARLNEARISVGRHGDDPGNVAIGIGSHTRVHQVR